VPRCSVIIATYNYGHYLAQAIDSVLEQTFTDFELLVIDDGSTDDTRHVVARFGPALRYLPQPHCGLAATRNTGIQEAQGDLLCLLDADDMWLPHTLATQVAYFDQHPDVGVVSAQCYSMDADGTVTGILPSPPVQGWVLEHLLLRGNGLRLPTVAMRRQYCEEVGRFDASLHSQEDWDLWLRLSRCCPFGYINQPLAKYRFHGSNLSRQLNPRTVRDRFAILDKTFADPTLPAPIQRQRTRVYSRAYAHFGHRYLIARQLPEARHYLWQAVRTSPWHLLRHGLLVSILRTYLGVSVLNALRTTRIWWQQPRA
jgi:glycosyltransferase involved in cell wall biosynthesis